MIVNQNKKRHVKLDNKYCGDFRKTFIVLEAGPTFNNYDEAIRMVLASKKSGADAIKFQIFNPDELVSDKKQLFEYEILISKSKNKTQKVSEPLFEILSRRCLSKRQWTNIKNLCDKIGLSFFSTIGSVDDLRFLEKIGCASYKIASADVNYHHLIKKVSETEAIVQLDTGRASISEIEKSINIINENSNKYILHHCPSGYPAKYESINLNMINTLRMAFNCPIAFSDHSPDIDIDIAAITVGSNMIEKTITFDRLTPSVEHIFSIEVSEISNFIKRIRNVEKSLGNFNKIIDKEERKSINKVRRSAFAKKDINANLKLNYNNIIFRRPGDGIDPELFDKINNKLKSNKKIKKGEMIRLEDIS